MDLKERILAYMKESAYKPLAEEELGEAMGLTDEELVDFRWRWKSWKKRAP